MKTPYFALAILASSAAAAGPPGTPSTWHEFTHSRNAADTAAVKRIEKMEWWKVCAAWGRASRGKDPRFAAAAQAYLVQERTINGHDLANLKARRPEIGMTFCGVLAQLGMPEALNQTARASGHHAQLVYRTRRLYVYTDGLDANGLVTSVQF